VSALDRAFLKVFDPNFKTASAAASSAAPSSSPPRVAADNQPRSPVPPPHFSLAHDPPLSADEVRSLVDPLPSLETSARLVAAFEVERLDWPAGIDELLAASEVEFRILSHELASAARRGRKKILVTACCSHAGCTTTALALARRLAASGLATALVDADFASGQISQRLGIAPVVGWERVLVDGLPLGEAMVESVAEGVTLVPLAAPDAELARQVDRGRLAETLLQLAGHADIVCIDGGTWAKGGESCELWSDAGVDLALVVRDVRRSSEDEARAVAAELTSAGVDRINVAENFVPVESAVA
jgi:Mrp family chromosome partitioning ATPase